MKEMDF